MALPCFFQKKNSDFRNELLKKLTKTFLSYKLIVLIGDLQSRAKLSVFFLKDSQGTVRVIKNKENITLTCLEAEGIFTSQIFRYILLMVS